MEGYGLFQGGFVLDLDVVKFDTTHKSRVQCSQTY